MVAVSNNTVLDASAFYAGVPFGSAESYCTTPEVYDEICHIKKSQDVISTLVSLGRLVVRPADDTYVQQVRLAAQRAGDMPQLSKSDVSVLALALQMKNGIITDDYAVSNTAKHLNLEVFSVMTRGIRTVGVWQYRCPACGIRQPPAHACNRCGGALRKKLVNKRDAV